MTTVFRFTLPDTGLGYDYEVSTEDGLSRAARVRVDAARVAILAEQRTGQASRNIKLPGFRPGKIPAHVVKAKFGDAILAETLEAVIRDVYPAVLAQEKRVAGVLDVKFEQGMGVREGAHHFVVRFEVHPEITVNIPAGIKLTLPSTEVSDAEVDSALESLRTERAQYTPKEDAIAHGDVVDVHYHMYEDDKDLGGHKHAKLRIGQANLHADIDAALQGAKLGDHREVSISYPADAGDGFAGRTIRFTLHIEGVSTSALPELNDEFAKTFDGITDLAALRTAVKESMVAERKQAADRAAEAQLMEALRAANPVELPETFVQNVQNRKADQLLEQFNRQGMFKAKWQVEKTRPMAMEAVRASARQSAHDAYLLDSVAKQNNITPSDADVETRLELLATHYQTDVDRLKNELGEQGLEGVKGELRNQKAFEFVRGKASVSTVDWKQWQAEQAAARQSARP